jgi:hypothetical protein
MDTVISLVYHRQQPTRAFAASPPAAVSNVKQTVWTSMAEIGEPLRRHHVIPQETPIEAPEGPRREALPEPQPPVPVRVPEKEPA